MVRSPLCWSLSLLVLGLALGAGCDGGRTTSVTSGSSAAGCSCPLDWQVDNLAVCVSAHTEFTDTLLYSSSLNGAALHCDPARSFPEPVPDQPWSAQRVSSRCAGAATLVLRVRQGTAAKASADDCIVAEQSFSLNYTTPGVPLELPPLGPWSAQSKTCARAYEEAGGYLEFRVQSSDVGCGVSDEVVKYVDQCPVGCDLDPKQPRCKACGQSMLTNSF